MQRRYVVATGRFRMLSPQRRQNSRVFAGLGAAKTWSINTKQQNWPLHLSKDVTYGSILRVLRHSGNGKRSLLGG